MRERTLKRSQYYYEAQIKHVCRENIPVVCMLIRQMIFWDWLESGSLKQ